MDLELVINPTRAMKLVAKPTTLLWDIIKENLLSIRNQKPKIIHYEEILSKYESRAKLA